VNIVKNIKLSKLRRFVLLGIIILFLLQFLKIKVLVGGLSGSLAVWFVKLLDIFAYFESLIASRDFTITALWAVLPVIGIYLIFGRAFCGWVCPMDFLFEIVDGFRDWSKIKVKASPKIGYGIAAGLLVVSGLIGIPFFTNYISHLTNFFRFITGGVFLALDLPFEPSVLAYSGGVIVLLLVVEYIFPRTWCRVLCPVGKTYGLFNKVSLLKLKFQEGSCGECNLCDQVCYMNVKIARNIDQPGLRDTNCIYCGRCAEGCETKGKLVKLSLGR
jgi:ferredoxin-type protein NapH